MLNVNLNGYYWMEMKPGYGWIETLQCVAFPKDDTLSFPWRNALIVHLTLIKIRELFRWAFYICMISECERGKNNIIWTCVLFVLLRNVYAFYNFSFNEFLFLLNSNILSDLRFSHKYYIFISTPLKLNTIT